MMQALSKTRGPRMTAHKVCLFGAAFLLVFKWDAFVAGVQHDYQLLTKQPDAVEESIGLLMIDRPEM